MNFQNLQERLVTALRERVMNGEISERRLASLTGISQPHIHNVLKGERILSNRAADFILQRLGLTLADLLEPTGNNVSHLEVPVLEGCLGPGLPLPTKPGKLERYPFSRSFLASIERPVLVRLAEDALLAGLFRGNDLVLLDRSRSARLAPAENDYFVVNRHGEGLVRRVSVEREDLLLLHGTPMSPAVPMVLPLQPCHLLDVVRARVAWVGRLLPVHAPRGPAAAWL